MAAYRDSTETFEREVLRNNSDTWLKDLDGKLAKALAEANEDPDNEQKNQKFKAYLQSLDLNFQPV